MTFPWVLATLRSFGSQIWPDVVRAIDGAQLGAAAGAVLKAADMTDPAIAVFLARHFWLFLAVDATGPLDELMGHRDWRVRAGLAEGLPGTGGGAAAGRIARTLVLDPDYKVRAALATGLASVDADERDDLVVRLLHDDNWHVRGRTILGLATGSPLQMMTSTVRAAVRTDPAWRDPPLHIAAVLARTALQLNAPELTDPLPVAALDRAAFSLIREVRTDWLRLPGPVREAIVVRAGSSEDWTTRRESGVADRPMRITHESFRRLRGRRTVQIALDLQDVGQAVDVAVAAATAGADLIEVGDLLIKQAGLAAITAVKRAVPDTAVVAEMMSADWGRDQVELAARAGADIVLLIGPASATSIAAAVEAGHRLGLPIMLDTPPGPLDRNWVRAVERIGVDALVVTTNVDHGLRGEHPLDRAHQVRLWTELPVAVSGGFTPRDHEVIFDPGWDVIIIGRSVAESIDPRSAARQVVDLIRAGTAT